MFDARDILGAEHYSHDDMSWAETMKRFTVKLPFDQAIIKDGQIELSLTAEGIEALIAELNRLKKEAN